MTPLHADKQPVATVTLSKDDGGCAVHVDPDYAYARCLDQTAYFKHRNNAAAYLEHVMPGAIIQWEVMP